ncbi:hypothetical protein [Lacticaseibacillus kribbianus]|uniref:hypothetical protein n=1 Tax=Lacticaseibacillus kribbianus TaxID=2926292 RepID=UPI001CD33CF2|nr:hypothetical protein [Lacticaseibacillus kribbianus]
MSHHLRVHIWIHRHLAWTYGVVSLACYLSFISRRYYRLKATLDYAYRGAHNTRGLGLSRFHGNLLVLRDPLMIALMVLGVIVGLTIFLNSRPLPFRAWFGLLIAGSSLIPFMPPYTENLVARLFCAAAFTLIGIIGQTMTGWDPVWGQTALRPRRHGTNTESLH